MADIVSLRKPEPRDLVLRETSAGIRRLTLNNPPLNALSIALMDALQRELEAASMDTTVRVVVIAAIGVVFSSGLDLDELVRLREAAIGEGEGEGEAEDQSVRAGETVEAAFARSARLMTAIRALPQPVIAEVDGLATAAGCELVIACDLAICTDTATFCVPGVNIGLVPAGAAVALSRTTSRKQAMEMLLTGETVDASTAKDFGLVNRIVPKPYLRQVVDKYAAVIASKSEPAQRALKATFDSLRDLPMTEAYAEAAKAEASSVSGPDAQEGIKAFLGNRMPVWPAKSET